MLRPDDLYRYTVGQLLEMVSAYQESRLQQSRLMAVAFWQPKELRERRETPTKEELAAEIESYFGKE